MTPSRPLAGTIEPLQAGPAFGEPLPGENDPWPFHGSSEPTWLSADGTWLLWRHPSYGWVASDLTCGWTYMDVANWPTHGYHKTLDSLVAHLEGERHVRASELERKVWTRRGGDYGSVGYRTACGTLLIERRPQHWQVSVSRSALPGPHYERYFAALDHIDSWLVRHDLKRGRTADELAARLAQAAEVDRPDEIVREAWRLLGPDLAVRHQAGEGYCPPFETKRPAAGDDISDWPWD
jgi:hypothetical protein